MLPRPGGYRYDLHVHSEASSDCRTGYRTLLRMALRRGLAGLAVNDHDTIEGALRLAEFWPHDRLHLITGCERTLADGSHVIGLFLQRALTAASPAELVREIREQGGLIYVPHPFRRYSGVAGEAAQWPAAELDALFEQADLIEVFNPKCSRDENRRALELATRLGKSVAASSDGHRAYEVGLAVTVFAAPLSPQAFRSQAVLAPPAGEAARLVARRRGEPSPARQSARALLKGLGLLDSVKAARDGLRCYQQPKLKKYP